MIAAFWDDMKNGSSGDVFYKAIDDGLTGESFVIEWSNMRTYDNNSRETFEIIPLSHFLVATSPRSTS